MIVWTMFPVCGGEVVCRPSVGWLIGWLMFGQMLLTFE